MTAEAGDHDLRGEPMNARAGPPEKEAARNRHEPGRQPRNAFHMPAYRAPRRQCGRYADAWREGFAVGFQDALRLAARELPPETWAVLEQLAQRYDLAGAA